MAIRSTGGAILGLRTLGADGRTGLRYVSQRAGVTVHLYEDGDLSFVPPQRGSPQAAAVERVGDNVISVLAERRFVQGLPLVH